MPLLTALLVLSVSFSAQAQSLAAACDARIAGVAAAPAAGPGGQAPARGWTDVTLPDFWQTRWADASTVWYRITWHNDCADGGPVALAIDSMSMAGEIRLDDGSLLWRDDSLQEPFSRSWNRPRFWLLPESAVKAGDNRLWIRVTGLPQDRLWLGNLELGDLARVRAVYENQRWLKRDVFTLNLAISLSLGFLFLTLWLIRRRESAFGWFALASMTWAAFAGTMLATTPWPFQNSPDWNRAVSLLFAAYCCSFCLFIWRFGNLSVPRLSRALVVLTAVVSIGLWWIPDARLPLALVAVMLLYMAILFGTCFHFPVYAWRNRERHNVLLALCLVVFLLVGLHDLLLVLEVVPAGTLLAPFTAPVAMLFMFLIVAERFARDFRRIEHFNTELQEAVSDARSELTVKLRRQHELELRNIRLHERLQLSHDLHDSLGSSLVRSMAMVQQSSGALGNHRFLSMLKELRDDLRQIIDSTSSGGASEESPRAWIAPLRQRFVRLFEEMGISSRWDVPEVWPSPLTAMHKAELLRFAEEALSNAIKHSRADHIEVCLRVDAEGQWLFCVSDNGTGFDVEAARNAGGVGMRSMAARARKLGGALEISSREGGTELCLRLYA
ncbi:MAG: 7TM diverse intracellular signaling domain-containing protein [Pseudohongiellaceae bacterium]